MSTFQSEAKIDLEWLEGEDFEIRFNSGGLKQTIVVERSQVPPEKVGGEARMLLAAALAECMASTLFFLLKWAQVEVNRFRATAIAVTAKDETGRLNVDSVDLTLNVDIPQDEETLKKLERVKTLFKRGCLVSRSLEKGIKVNYAIQTQP
jgi:organic hydroperoxide reductase OsmC/OhrA